MHGFCLFSSKELNAQVVEVFASPTLQGLLCHSLVMLFFCQDSWEQRLGQVLRAKGGHENLKENHPFL